MGYEILALGFVFGLFPMVVLGFIAFWVMTHQERSALEDTWRGYASARSREYVGARGDWPNRSSPRVRWSANDRRYELSVVGVEATARTQLETWPRGRVLGDFRAAARTEDAPASSRRAIDAHFESAFAVTERPKGLARRVLDSPAHKALLGFRQRDAVVLRYARGRLMLSWPGREGNDARIDEAERVLHEVARAVEDAFRAPVVSG